MAAKERKTKEERESEMTRNEMEAAAVKWRAEYEKRLGDEPECALNLSAFSLECLIVPLDKQNARSRRHEQIIYIGLVPLGEYEPARDGLHRSTINAFEKKINQADG